MTGDTDANDPARSAHDPPADEPTRTVKFGGGARAHFIDLLGPDTELGRRIRDRGFMEPVPFTVLELKAIAHDRNRENVTANAVLNADLRIGRAIRELEAETERGAAEKPAATG